MTQILRRLAAVAVAACCGSAAFAQGGFLPGGLPQAQSPQAQSPATAPLPGGAPAGFGASLQDDAEANRRASDNYNAVLQDRPAFRAEREQIECAGIESLDLRAQCLATFENPGQRQLGPPAANPRR